MKLQFSTAQMFLAITFIGILVAPFALLNFIDADFNRLRVHHSMGSFFITALVSLSIPTALVCAAHAVSNRQLTIRHIELFAIAQMVVIVFSLVAWHVTI